ncbi:MAG: hypothetical protein ACTSRG_17460 [Candidatus Helarchaeota archaeon]
MKIILSRKGFDSSFGGYPSPIFPNGSLLSLPIPGHNYVSGYDYNNDKYVPVEYKFLQIPSKLRKFLEREGLNDIESYNDLMLNLFMNKQGEKIKKIKKALLEKNKPYYCHLDSDIILEVLPNVHRKPMFGVLPNYIETFKDIIKPHDLFLFYGWYRWVIIDNGRIRYAINRDSDKINHKISVKGMHLIYGYFQVGRIIRSKSDLESWIEQNQIKHPHLDKNLWNKSKNGIYIATKKLVLNKKETKFSGAGIFNFNKELILTEMNKKLSNSLNKSIWRNDYFPPSSYISHYGNKIDKSHWTDNGCFQWKTYGQEFVIEDCPVFERFISNNILKFIDS